MRRAVVGDGWMVRVDVALLLVEIEQSIRRGEFGGSEPINGALFGQN